MRCGLPAHESPAIPTRSLRWWQRTSATVSHYRRCHSVLSLVLVCSLLSIVYEHRVQDEIGYQNEIQTAVSRASTCSSACS